MERRGVRLFELRAELNGQLDSPRALEILGELFEMPKEGDTTFPPSDAVTFLFKYAHGAEPDKPFEHPPLLVCQVTTNRPEVVELGLASVVLWPSPYDSPWGRVKVVEMLGAAYTVSHNTMLPPTVLGEVDGEAFLPYSLLKYEW